MLKRALKMSLLLASAWIGTSAWAVEVGTQDTGHVQNPQWSPNGEWLAFEVNNMSNTIELYLVPVNGGQPGQPSQLKVPGASSSFGAGGYVAAAPEWATNPNLMVIFEGSSPGGNMRLYYASPGAGAPNELLSSSQMQGNLGAPTMAPNGQRFGFVSDATGKGDVYIWDINSGEISVVFASNDTESFPTFDANGQKLVFSRKNNGTEDLFTWEGGTNIKPLSGGAGDQTRPVWAGESVVFFSGERGEGLWDIKVTEGAGKGDVVAQNVRLPARSTPALTPDGSAVVWASANPDQGSKLFVSKLDGSGTKEIETGMVACGDPSVVTAGGRTLLAFTALPKEGSDWRRLHIIDVTGKI